ncbi:MAG: hypothetical protein LR017_01835 [Candidatus Pacebacteria bacterium]|nr:hypothetical protein [Candidatus Paceibacterota bacterium]
MAAVSQFSDCRDCTPAEIYTRLEIFLDNNASITELLFVDTAGHEVAHLLRYGTHDTALLQSDDTHTFAQHEFYTATQAGSNYISGVALSSFELPYVLMSVPVRNENLEISGSVVAVVDLGPLWGTISQTGIKKWLRIPC